MGLIPDRTQRKIRKEELDRESEIEHANQKEKTCEKKNYFTKINGRKKR